MAALQPQLLTRGGDPEPFIHINPEQAAQLADGSAEQVPDAVGEGQAERSADDDPQDGAADVAPPKVAAARTCRQFTLSVCPVLNHHQRTRQLHP